MTKTVAPTKPANWVTRRNAPEFGNSAEANKGLGLDANSFEVLAVQFLEGGPKTRSSWDVKLRAVLT
jgi:hypothetical protein